jgi:hypothetical protein
LALEGASIGGQKERVKEVIVSTFGIAVIGELGIINRSVLVDLTQRAGVSRQTIAAKRSGFRVVLCRKGAEGRIGDADSTGSALEGTIVG